MKKGIVFMVLIALLSVPAKGQIRFGLKAGVNFTDFNWSSNLVEGNVNNATGWQAGAMLQVKLPIVGIGLQPELLYTVSKADEGQAGYFQIPVNLRWQIIGGPVKPILMAGPYFGYAVDLSKEWKDSFKKTDWGVGLGGGVEVWKLQAMLRYSWGLQNILEASEFKMKNNVFTVSLGYFF